MELRTLLSIRKHHLRSTLAAGLLTLFMQWMTSCNPRSVENPALTAELDAYFSAVFHDNEPGGSILLLQRDSVLFSRSYGLADLRTGEPITSKTLFNIGSLSKTFVANAILILREQQRLSLEDSLIKYFPTFKNKSIAQKVKIKHLLTHTSGLPDLRNVAEDSVFYLTAKDAENWEPVLQTESLLFEPGSEFEYSNPAFNGLALIVEQVSGMKWQQFVEQQILKPSGMELSTITDGSHPESGVSHGYVYDRGKWIEDDYGEEPTFAAAGNGGVWSSIDELANYERALQTGVFLPESVVAESRMAKQFYNWRGTRRFTATWSWITPRFRNNVMMPFIGWSWFKGRTADGSRVTGHTGTQGGFITNFVSIPEKELFVVILCNSPRDVYAFTDKILAVMDIDH